MPASTSAAAAAATASGPAAAAVELTLIVAATRSMGIGAAGGLPWTGLKKEMAYFARVTKRLPAQGPSDALNAVIMGRKTWDSIPPKFRPLKGRLNLVISRSAAAAAAAATMQPQPPQQQQATAVDEGPVRVPSLEAALEFLQTRAKSKTTAATAHGDGDADAQEKKPQRPLGKVFVIGGAQIYDAALKLPAAKRVLLTSILEPEFECDTFFPLRLGREGHNVGEDGVPWRRRDKGDLDAWVGEDVPAGEQEENGTKYEFQMWEKEA